MTSVGWVLQVLFLIHPPSAPHAVVISCLVFEKVPDYAAELHIILS